MVGNAQILGRGDDHEVGGVVGGGGDEGVGPLGAGLPQRVHGGRIGLDHKDVVFPGDGLGPLGVALDHRHIVAVAYGQIHDGAADSACADDDEVHTAPILPGRPFRSQRSPSRWAALSFPVWKSG
jgi:hypothetical protein